MGKKYDELRESYEIKERDKKKSRYKKRDFDKKLK